MTVLRTLIGGLRALFRKSTTEQELDEELQGYLESAVQQNIAGGKTPEQALRAARLEMGNAEVIKEQVRDAGWESLVESFWQDIRYALRTLRKNPGFTAVVVITLALGIGANTAIFSLINAVMLRPVPVRDPQQLVILKWKAHKWPKTRSSYGWSGCPVPRDVSNNPAPAGCSFSKPMFEQVRAQRDVFSGVLALVPRGQFAVSIAGTASLAGADFASGDFFSTLGVHAAAGRVFGPGDDAANASSVVVLSHAYWKRQFGSDPSVIGRAMRISGVPFTIIGVAMRGFSGLDPGVTRDFWLPLAAQSRVQPVSQTPDDPTSWWLLVIGRLRPGVSAAQAEAATNVVFQRGLADNPKLELQPQDAPRVELVSIGRGLVSLRKHYSGPLLLLMITVGIVLLIACANVASLMLARSSARRREIAMRFALGARRGRIVRQLLTESILLAGFGGAIGLAVAYAGASSLVAFLAASAEGSLDLNVRPDAHILAFTSVLALLAGILCGLVPALRGTQVNVTPILKETAGAGERRFGLGKGLVIGQVALSVLVLVAAGLLTRTLANLQGMDVGFDARNVLLFDVDTSSAGYKEQQLANLYPELQQRLSGVPGVARVSYSMPPLLDGAYMTRDINIWGQANGAVEVGTMDVGPDFFETMHIPLLAGRSLQAQDFQPTPARKVVLVNQALVKRFFGSQNPVGHRIVLGSDGAADTEIVGVAGDARSGEPRREIEPMIYCPLRPGDGASGTFEIRSAGDPKALIPAIRRVVTSVNASLAVLRTRTQTEQIDETLSQERLVAGLSGVLGLLSLTLASVGLYGLIAYLVTRRTHEIGIRIALGAEPRDVATLIVGQGLLLAAAGALLGMAAATALTRYLASALYGIRPRDPVTFAGVVVLLLLVAFAACYIPARRAMRVDPMIALRDE